MFPLIPVLATTILFISDKKNWQPGYLIVGINGMVFLLFAYIAGPQAPSWPMAIGVCVGTSFMFNNPRVGQISMIFFSIAIAVLFYFMGATLIYSLTIVFSLIAFIILFARTYDYLQILQSRIEENNHKIEASCKELELKNKDVTDSINYAKKIQYAVLPNEETIYRNIPLSFIYYKPKDIVSGDFFWFHQIDEQNYIIVCADCTGHGVPGAFMTVIGSSLLNQIVIEDKILEPAKILAELDRRIVMTLKQGKEKTITVQDGMDLALLKVNKTSKELIITGAKRPIVFVRNGQLKDLKGSKFSLGGMRYDEKKFDDIKLNYEEDDMLYFYTDGFTDQFGGEKGKKFSSKRLKECFFAIHNLKVSQQKEKLEEAINKWKGEQEQVDDILVMGIKF